jgi:superfamily I DNA/RNA helicase
MKRIGRDQMDMASDKLLDAIEGWEMEEVAKGKKEAASVHDRADAMKVFARRGKDLSQAINYAKDLFAQKGKIQLLSGHKSKGLEWDTVYHLDPWRVPSKFAKSEEELDQEYNLDYVITTRSKDRLYLINLEDIG